MEEKPVQLEDIVSLAKRRGFVFPGSELYGGLAGTYDYGPLGSLLKENIRQSWIRKFVHDRADTFLIDSAILMNPTVWEAAGHVEEFVDPLVEDTVTQKRYRADHLLEAGGVEHADELSIEEMNALIAERKITSPDGNPLGPVREFNMMLETNVGAAAGSVNKTYLRPETAQGIFVNFKNVLDTMHPKVPFGIAQVGKAFRNEITPREFIFRLRELEQMELEYFIHPSQWEEQFQYWEAEQYEWIVSVGIAEEKLSVYEHPAEARAHYSEKTIDWEFEYPFGKRELSGVAYRTDFDLLAHAKRAKEKLQYTDPQTGETYVPHVIEPTVGIDRMILALLCSAYREDVIDGASRTYLKLPPHIAPFIAAVSPLLKNKPELVDRARSIFGKLKASLGNVAWDDNGNIGKRYRRHDEVGTPFFVTIDFDTVEDDTVTVRFRDTAAQERVVVDDLIPYLQEKLEEA